MKKIALVCALLLIACRFGSADSGLARHKKMYIVPAPGKVTIDGKLDDWDLSGRISTYVISETEDMQSARFAMMYDKNNLYFGAEVRDTTPMLNHSESRLEPAQWGIATTE